jgi:tetratricopeptide (TPR) repeat protein
MWGIAPLLSHFFKKVTFLHSAQFHYELAQLLSPSYIISCSVERFLMNVGNDTDRPMALDIPIYYGKHGETQQLTCLETHFQLNPKSELHRTYFAQALAREKKVDEAISLLEEEILFHPEALCMLGRLQMSKKLYDEAANNFAKAINIFPSNTGYYFHLSKALQRTGIHEGALDAAEKAYSLRPNSIELKQHLNSL